jgi:type IV secretory pathway VirB10-like protein
MAFVLLALASLTAAAGGAYVATRHNATDLAATPAPAPAAQIASAPAAAPALAPTTGAASQPVAETEVEASKSEVSKKAEESKAKESKAKGAKPIEGAPQSQKKPAPSSSTRTARATAASARTVTAAPPAAAQTDPPPPPAPVVAASTPEPARAPEPAPEPRRVPQFEDVILPPASVIGLQLETALSSEHARVEDRVDARVTRDVMAAGRVAIPAGSRVRGSVTAVERGGKVKQPAHLAIRFHTLVLADGSELALHTEVIDRFSESPAGSSAKKIGGAAVGGAILGAILGGGKGAATGGAIGAAGGTAAVMAGDRSVVTLAPGSVLNAKLSTPATITVERRDQ